MFLTAYLFGIFGLFIYFLGISQLLIGRIVIPFTLLYWIISIAIFWNRISFPPLKFPSYKNRLNYILLGCLVLLSLVNLVGALGPELAFDALWYHLTIPKIYLMQQGISFIPGGLLYYSAMPKLGEMYYVVALMFSNELFAKLIHYSFGLLTTLVVYRISKNYYKGSIALLLTLLFYSNLVISWLSITAYIDLIRTFYELIAFWAFLKWYEKRDKKWLLTTSLMLGFAAATKVLALGSLLIFLVLLAYTFLSNIKTFRFNILSTIALFVFGTFLVPLPWVLSSIIDTGNPVYPFFSSIYPVTPQTHILNPVNFLTEIFKIFTQAADPVSPVYLALAPLALLIFKKFSNVGKLFAIYSLIALIIWYITPRTGGGRFLAAYLPVFSLFIGEILIILQKEKLKLLYNFSIVLIIITSVLTIIIRGYENTKYLPVLSKQESKEEFLTKNLNFNFGDFYDTDNFFKKTISQKDKVLLIGFHNLYYVNFPFIHESYLKEGDKFNYIAVQNGDLPKEYIDWHLIYENKITHVKLYKKGRFIGLK